MAPTAPAVDAVDEALDTPLFPARRRKWGAVTITIRAWREHADRGERCSMGGDQ